MSQSINLVAGIYSVNFAAAQRAGQKPDDRGVFRRHTNRDCHTKQYELRHRHDQQLHGDDRGEYPDLPRPKPSRRRQYGVHRQSCTQRPQRPSKWKIRKPESPCEHASISPQLAHPGPTAGTSGWPQTTVPLLPATRRRPRHAGRLHQQTGKISQTIKLAAGTYNIASPPRAVIPGQQPDDRSPRRQPGRRDLQPAGTSYSTLTTGPFTVTGGPHTLTFVGLNPNGGDNTALIDGVAVNQPALQIVPYIQDPDFASPSVGVGISAYQADPAGSPWTFTGSAGVAGNGSAFTSGNQPAPVGAGRLHPGGRAD